MMMIQWWIITFFLFLIKYSCINCISNQCNYIVKKSDNSWDRCVGDECYKFIDLLSIIVEPKDCKTSILLLSFSSYKNFILFRDQLQWKIGDLFLSRSINSNREFILFIDQLDYNDKPFDYNELIHLGINIDLYILYIKNIKNKNNLYGLIHHDINNPQWNIIKIKFRCLKLSAFDQYPCSSEIISPPLFASQQPLPTLQSTSNITNLSTHLLSFSSSTEESIIKSNEEKNKSTQLILIIIIPLLIILILMILFILIYIYITGKYCFNQDIMTTSKSPSSTTISNHPVSIERIPSSSSLSDNTIVPENRLNVDQVQNHCHRHIKTHSTKNLDSNYERVTLDNISVIRQQYFVPISSINF